MVYINFCISSPISKAINLTGSIGRPQFRRQTVTFETSIKDDTQKEITLKEKLKWNTKIDGAGNDLSQKTKPYIT